MSQVLQELHAQCSRSNLTIVRVKNRFSRSWNARSSCGYRDYQALITIPGGWIIEVQIIPRLMYSVKTDLGQEKIDGADDGLTGHGAYKEYRHIQEARQRQQIEMDRILARDPSIRSNKPSNASSFADDIYEEAKKVDLQSTPTLPRRGQPQGLKSVSQIESSA